MNVNSLSCRTAQISIAELISLIVTTINPEPNTPPDRSPERKLLARGGVTTPLTTDHEWNARLLRTLDVQKHEKAIKAVIENGELVARDHSGFPIPSHAAWPQIQNATITAAEFAAYVEPFGLTVHDADGEMVQPGAKAKLPIAESRPTQISESVSKTAAQDSAIHDEIRSLKLGPQRLEKPLAGRRGVKADIREQLLKKPKIFISKKVFDTAWQRLLDNSEIKYVEHPTCK